MAMIGQRQQLGIRDTGTTATVPDNDKARLMYYLSCINSVLNLSGSIPSKLMDYKNWWRLDETETQQLCQLYALLGPSELNGKCIFLAGSDVTRGNDFYELTATTTSFVAASSVLIGGQRRRVAKIMVYNETWIRNNFHRPGQNVLEELNAAQRRREQNNSWCSIQ